MVVATHGIIKKTQKTPPKEIKRAQHLTQTQLGEKIGVQKSRICSIEKGVNLRLSTLRRIFKALGMSVKLDIAEMDTIPIC